MGGTDSIDYRADGYICKPKSRRWTIVAWCYTLDMSRCNAQTIYALNTGTNPLDTDSFEFGVDIVDALVKPFIESRSLNGLHATTARKMELVLERKLKLHISNEKPIFPKSNDEKRCHICVDECEGSGHKSKKAKLHRVKSCCMFCGKNTCSKHIVAKCEKCS